MKTNRLLHRMFMLVVSLMLLFSVNILADGDGRVVSIPINSYDSDQITAAIKSASTVNGGTASTTDVKINRKAGGSGDSQQVKLFNYDSSGGSLKFYPDNFKAGNSKEVKKAMSDFIDSLRESSISADTQQDIMNQIQESDSDVASFMLPLIFDNTKADLFTAYKWLYPFLQALRVVFGIGSVVIILLLISSTIIDLAYIGLPTWREHTEEKQASQGKGSKKPFGVSYEALSTVLEVEKELGVYRNAYIMYAKRRATTYIVLAIAVLYLIAGELSGLISWVLQLASGIVE